ncbi:MAG: PIN domain-containing protein [Verrucomicrobia bacterium]|nr:PIN domain-containing protein [Verrucomicrobiota bacterium]
MSADFFLDTNILVYSFDDGEPAKRDKARELIEQALETRRGAISWQVVQEFLNVALHKWHKPMTPADSREYLQTVLNPLCAVYPSTEIWSASLRIAEESQYRFYDSLIVAAAIQSGATIIYSEDLQHGRQFGTLEIRNPFC